MPTSGRNTIIKVSTDGTAFSAVDGLNKAEMDFDGNNLDVTKFGMDFVARIQGIKDATYSLGGFLENTDTDGQVAIRDAWLNDTDLYVQFLGDGSAGFKQKVKVNKYSESSAPDDLVQVSIDLDGTDDVTAV